jgi:uncharacterized protein YijF (DUF1287 family)
MLSRRHVLLSGLALPFGFSSLAWADRALESGARQLIRAAENQIGETRFYDPAYVKLGYPGGDVPRDRGVCSDVVIRAYRDGLQLDLQRLVHEDMKASFAAYPAHWGLSRTDRNIDHRRVPNLAVFLKRQGAALPKGSAFQPGDIVTQSVNGHLPHVVIVSDERHARSGRLKVIHNIGAGTVLEDTLSTYPMTGHYRWFGMI